VRVVYERCCGLDVHKRTVVACVRTPDGQQSRTFETMTAELLRLGDWLTEQRVTHVAMESTGVFWKPVYNLLEGLGFTLLVVNARHIKAVPGRKTDVKDAAWIAELLQHGLLKGSFIPDRPQRELRELVRYRRTLLQERGRLLGRIQKLLEGANIKLSAVASDIVGVSGRAMLEALADGTTAAAALASLARGRLRSKRPALERALRGLMGAHQRALLRSQLRLLDSLDAEIARMDDEVATRMRPVEAVLERLDTIPGVGRRGAEELLAEIGTDMGRFPSAAHLASWARVCPGTDESAGNRKRVGTGHGNPWLRCMLVEAARAAARARRTYLAARYRRLAARRGANRAAMAVGHTIAVIANHLIRDETVYQDLGPNYFDERDREAVVRRSVRRIQQLGYRVTIEEAA
jgi:transposase